MERPIVRQIDSQRVESEREITGSEAEELLRKYGHGQPQRFSTFQEEPQSPPQTFEEMIKLQEDKERLERERRAQINGPKPITFNGQNGYSTETKYGSDDELGFGFKIEITTDMKLPK